MCKGYYCDDFFKLSNDFNDSDASSSREVLLAAGWFILNQNIFEKFLSNSDCVFDYECAKDTALDVRNFVFDFIIINFYY
jgi:hypothetical protein